MRSREKIKNSFEAGECNGVLDAVAPELILEVLLDIRELLLPKEPRSIRTKYDNLVITDNRK